MATEEERMREALKSLSLEMKAFNSKLGLADAERIWQAARASAWQDISTAPKDGTRVLLWADMPEWKGFAYEVSYWDKEEADWGDVYWEPTHWMPLPTPPNRSESDE